MSEKIIHPEHHHKSHEASGEHHKEHSERLKSHKERAVEHAKHERSELNLAKLREQAKEHAEAAASHKADKEPDSEPQTGFATTTALKAHAFDQSLKRIQKHLSKPNRAFSKVVHNPTIDAISNVGAATVARPSGILGGSICAFVGSLLLLYAAKHYGFRYNYFMLIVLFIGGFFIGSLLELLIWALYSRKKHY